MPVLERLLFWALLGGGGVWTAFALYFQTEGARRLLAYAALLLLAAGLLVLRAQARLPLSWAVLLTGALVSGVWYQSIRPRDDRVWAAEVSRNVKARVEGDIVQLRDIRDFAWTSVTEAEQRWQDGSYDLSRLSRVDMATSVWASPKIAHLLVSFGFDDGRHIAFSAEIRREEGEAFSELGGFFRQFELALIAATEDDILQLRSHQRGERVSLFEVDLSAEDRRALFLTYVELAQSLEEAPRFYNTLTANCTTVVWRLGRILNPALPIGSGLVLSGYLPGYLEGLGLLGGEGDLAQKTQAARLDPAQISARMAAGESYSQAIRHR